MIKRFNPSPRVLSVFAAAMVLGLMVVHNANAAAVLTWDSAAAVTEVEGAFTAFQTPLLLLAGIAAAIRLGPALVRRFGKG